MSFDEYFNEKYYTGYHYHEECWEPVYKFYLETIVEERVDGSWDVFFDEPIDDYENNFFIKEKDYQDTPTGLFLFNAKDRDDVTDKFRHWAADIIANLRNNKKS